MKEKGWEVMACDRSKLSSLNATYYLQQSDNLGEENMRRCGIQNAFKNARRSCGSNVPCFSLLCDSMLATDCWPKTRPGNGL